MQHFSSLEFIALKPAKAKATALAMFAAAQLDATPDWHSVALALHAAYSPKPRISQDDIAMEDSALAGEFAAWADYQPTGKGTAIARGRVAITFADGWTVTVGLLAGRTAKGRKPWSIGHAARFAVLCYKLAAARRATGSDDLMYHEPTGNGAGISVPLNGLISAPEIISLVSADSAETVEGDLVWDPIEASALTLDQRAGAVAVPLDLAPVSPDAAHALQAAREALLGELGLIYSPMHAMAKEAAARVEALLFAGGSMAGDYDYSDELFSLVWDNRDDYPESDAALAEREERITAAIEEDTALAPASDDEPGLFADAPAQVETREPVDHTTMLAASEIVMESAPLQTQGLAAWHVAHNRGDERLMPDDWAYGLSPVTYMTRFTLVEDALLAWPAMAEPAVFVDGVAIEVVETAEPVDIEAFVVADGWEIGPHGKWINPARNDGAAYTSDNPRSLRYIVEDYKLGSTEAGRSEDESAPPAACRQTTHQAQPVEAGASPAAFEAVAEPAPRVKPRYRVRADGSYELVTA